LICFTELFLTQLEAFGSWDPLEPFDVSSVMNALARFCRWQDQALHISFASLLSWKGTLHSIVLSHHWTVVTERCCAVVLLIRNMRYSCRSTLITALWP